MNRRTPNRLTHATGSGKGNLSPRLGITEAKLAPADLDRAGPGVLVLHRFHLCNVVEPADHVRGPEALAGLHLLAVQFLDEADIPPLMTPRLTDRAGVEGHARQPRPRPAGDLHL